jgi:hypothetical protein
MSFGALTVSLTDYILLAFLQLVMYLLTIIEAGLGDGRQTATASIDRSKAATWAFIGVFLTLVAGAVAKSVASPLAEGLAFAIAVYAIGQWGFFHWSISKLLDSSVVENELFDIYRRALVGVFTNAAGTGLSESEVAARLLTLLQGPGVFFANARVFKQLFPVSVRMMVDRLFPTPENLRPLLERLVKDGVLRFDDNKYYPAKQLLTPTPK